MTNPTPWLPFVAVILLCAVAFGLAWWARGHVDKEHWLERNAQLKIDLAEATAQARSDGFARGQASAMASFAHAYSHQVRRLYSDHGIRTPNQYRSNKPGRGRHAVDTGFIPKVTDHDRETEASVPSGAAEETIWK